MNHHRIWTLSLALCITSVVAAPPGRDSSDPLAAVDRTRKTLIADIVRGAEYDLTKAAPGRVAEESAKLAERLSKLRADRLLAASLSSSLASLQSVLHEAEALGDAGTPHAKPLPVPPHDLVYTPLTPCRLIDTRGFGAPIQGGAFTPGTRRFYTPNGLCGLPIGRGIASMLVSLTTENLTPGSGGYLTLLAPGTPVSTTSDVFNLGSEWSASTAAVATAGDGEFDVVVSTATAHVVIDILGYFAPMAASTVQTAQIADGAVTGAKLSPNGCSLGQVMQFTNSGWGCGTAIVGPQGPQGVAGAQGPAGVVDYTMAIANQSTVQPGANFNISGNGVVGGSLSANSLLPTYDSGWFEVVVSGANNIPARNANGDIVLAHNMGFIPSRLMLQQCGAVASGACVTSVVIAGTLGSANAGVTINPVSTTATSDTLVLAMSPTFFVWAYYQGGTYICPGSHANCFGGYYRVLAWR